MYHEPKFHPFHVVLLRSFSVYPLNRYVLSRINTNLYLVPSDFGHDDVELIAIWQFNNNGFVDLPRDY
jgi:hypothetical protein